MIKTWFITGASSGFGRKLTELLLERGDRVAATVRKPDALHNLATKYGERLWVGILDVTDSSAVRDIVSKAFAELKRIDVIVGNAGYALFGAAEEVADAQIKRQIDTNLVGSISVARAVIPHLRQQGGWLDYPDFVFGRTVGLSNDGCLRRQWGIEGFFEGHYPGDRTFWHRGDPCSSRVPRARTSCRPVRMPDRSSTSRTRRRSAISVAWSYRLVSPCSLEILARSLRRSSHLRSRPRHPGGLSLEATPTPSSIQR
ncbi:SDR family NAD(P)-dependent oxidoreductase [Bradyrhizobium sp. RT9b]|uniref:SDR family NAD(P)-dependent oxidoreductase n=1 Tax=Bradyrhizobium sp. RT9b TaxID=3156385 RepID=UPI0033987E00